MAWFAIILLIIQFLLLSVFSFFSFFNYLYSIASLWKPELERKRPSGKKVAVVIVSFNEKYVLTETIRACDELSYPNKLTVLADDSTDPEVVEMLRNIAISRCCMRLEGHPFFQDVAGPDGQLNREPVEIWESPDFVLFHRPTNAGFKAGSLQKVQQYLEGCNIGLMYLLDADWHPQKDALERTVEVLEARDDTAFVQTKRVSFPKGMNLFQRYVTMLEEGCYYVDFEGRQVLGHPMLFSGCCTLLRLDAIRQVGGFTPGHLTEDLDLTDRFWLNGWKGIYLSNVINYGEVPFTYDHFRRQQERWAAGSARSFREFAWPIVESGKLSLIEKLSALRQNAYYTTNLFGGIAILVGMMTVMWLFLGWDTYSVEYYLYVMGLIKAPLAAIAYLCVLSNFVEPLIMLVVKKRTYLDILHFPMMVWYAWGLVPTYVVGNLKGLFGLKLDWFRTPKFIRSQAWEVQRMPTPTRAMNLCLCLALICFYFCQGWFFGWFDEFGLLLIPAYLLATVK
jgi:cellulose synthase/poly-beta-1,6-N-acetylglucosamine synthase-like glycosyltransferase